MTDLTAFAGIAIAIDTGAKQSNSQRKKPENKDVPNKSREANLTDDLSRYTDGRQRVEGI